MVHSDAKSVSIPGPDMSALIARLEAAEAGSRELDAAVWAASNGYELFEHDGAGWRYRMKPDDIMRHERTGYISPYTTSLDAALALAERVLPGWAWNIERWGKMTRITLNECDNEGWHRSKHVRIEYASERSPALALVIATLKAVSAKGEGG